MRIAYLSLQAVAQGQDSWAAVNEIITCWEQAGWTVDRWFPTYAGTGSPGALARLTEMTRLQRALGRQLDRYDALYVRGHPMAYAASRAAFRTGVPVFQECNGTYEDLFIAWPATRWARPLFEHMQRAQYRDATLIFCGTEPQRSWLEAETGHNRVVVSPNGANHEIFTPAATKPEGLPERYVLFFGQFAEWQGIDVLIAAQADPAWPAGVELVFAGDGQRRPAVEAAARAQETIHYLGRLPYEQLPGVIAHSLAATSPQNTASRAQAGFSALKLYESMACGVPVIGTDYPGVGDVIRRYDSGIVVAPGDAGALAAAVALLASDDALAARLGANGRSAVEREASWAARASQRRAEIERAVARGAVHPEGRAL